MSTEPRGIGPCGPAHVVRCLVCSSAYHERDDCPHRGRAKRLGISPRRLRHLVEGPEDGEPDLARAPSVPRDEAARFQTSEDRP